MVRTVIEHCLDVLYLASCERALVHALEKSLLNCRYVVLRNRSAEELLAELEAFLLGRRESDVYITVLSCTAGLLFVLALYVGVTLDGLSVCDLLRNYVYAYAVSVLELGLDDTQLDVSLTSEQSLVCLCVPLEYECRILFHESGETLSHLFVLVLVGSLYGYEVAWTWERDRIDPYLLALAAERVACLCVLELAESYEVAGCYAVCVLLGLASYEEYGAELLGLL